MPSHNGCPCRRCNHERTSDFSALAAPRRRWRCRRAAAARVHVAARRARCGHRTQALRRLLRWLLAHQRCRSRGSARLHPHHSGSRLRSEARVDAARRLSRRGQQPGEAAGERGERADHSGRASPRRTRGRHRRVSLALQPAADRHPASCHHRLEGHCTFERSVGGRGGGRRTRFASLSYRVQASQYINGAKAETQLDRSTLSFAQQGGQIVRVLPQTSPKQAFDGLFTGFMPANSADAGKQALELQKRKSVLDTVDRSFAGLLPRLGQWDRQRIERHYEEVRALEKLLATPAPMTGGACKLPADPGADPPVGGDLSGLTGWSSNGGYSQEDQRAHAFTKLVHMALVCDLSRSVALMYTMFQSFMNAYPLVGEQFNAHELNHKSGQAPLDKMIAWHVGLFGELVALLRDTPENGGTLLDSCAMVLLNEGGDGYGAVEGSHSTERMACLIAGGASGLRRGEHIVAPKGTHPAQVLTTLMDAVGAPVTGLGEISGTVPSLLR